MLTGSSSKGKNKHYYYYHWDYTCGVRYNAAETNKLFLKLLKSWVLNPAAVELLKLVISSVYKTRTQSDFNKKSQVLNDITKHNEKIAKARGLLLDGELDSADYKEIKADSEAVIARLEIKLQETSDAKTIRLDINKLTDKIITSFCDLDKVFEKAKLEKQRHFLCSLFPEKIHFDEVQHRTARVNVATQAI